MLVSIRRRLAVASKGAQHRAGLRPAALAAFYPAPMRQFSAAQSAENTATPDASFQPIIHDVFEEKTGTWQYVVVDPNTLTATIIDSVLDYDPLARTISTHSADKILSLIKRMGYRVDSILETHIHADHLTAARYLQTSLHKEQGYLPLITVGKRIVHIQELFRQKYGLSEEETRGVFDRFLDDDERFHIGSLEAQAIHLPGHTPDHMGFKIGDNIFCGDSVFHADIGSARCDFPGGSAEDLYASARKLLSFPDHVKIWTGHDYPSQSRSEPVPYLSVGGHRAQNKHLMDGYSKDDFVALRRERDSKLAEPRLLHQSLQMNIRAGSLPKPSPEGDRMLHTPLDVKQLDM
ncbi:Beta-lactamase-like protein [Metarhizium guizhouense ARSEF 977]|uniref:Beta-lactamase-like protein n=1 Tax=Metarhizium guizhouense (strain ARSEF 977) TaxID=1276136 RepID=A0A0B4HZR1_METGA|nr:Beta-lactamase-like protein [Metarhizium guizhouense ARSEF 977]